MPASDGSIFDDVFVAADGTDLDTFPNWIEDAGSVTPITTLDNRLIADGASSPSPAIYFRTSSAAPTTTYAAEAGIYFITTDVDSFSIFLDVDAGDGYATKYDGVAGELLFARVDAFSTNVLDSAAYAPPTDTLIPFVYRRDGSRHRLYVAGVLMIDVVEGTYSHLADIQLITSADINATQGGHVEYLRMGNWIAGAQPLVNRRPIASLVNAGMVG